MKRTYPKCPLIGVGGIIFKHNKVLLIKRAHPPSEGKWSVPGGLVEIGETLRAAIIREVEEEVGLKVRPENMVDVIERIIPDSSGKIIYHYVIVDFLCTILAGSPVANSDVKEAVFYSLNQLNRLELSPELVNIIKKAYKIWKGQ
jgi:8-oxo-dGTP diphosphatase